MKPLLLLLPALTAVLCVAQEANLPAQLARIQLMSKEQLQSLQAQLALDPAPAAKKAYHELNLAYVLATRQRQEDPKGTKALVERSLKTAESTKDPEAQALVGALLGLKIGFAPMSGMYLSPKATKLFDEALAQRPGSPRITLLKAIHVLHSPAFVGGGAKAALPLMEQAVALAEKEPPAGDPWAPAWGLKESLGWLAFTQVEAEQVEAARKTVDRALALEPGHGFITRMVLPRLQAKGK